MNNQEIIKKIQDLEQIISTLVSLKEEFYKNNFSSRQDFFKFCDFKSGMKVTVYSSLPSTCEEGYLAVSNGKLYVCSAVNTWTVVGTQS